MLGVLAIVALIELEIVPSGIAVLITGGFAVVYVVAFSPAHLEIILSSIRRFVTERLSKVGPTAGS